MIVAQSRFTRHDLLWCAAMRRRGFIAAVLLVLCGCLWRGYATIVAVHLDVLTQTAAKLSSIVESGHGPSAQAMAEYVYPAQRAREFLQQFRNYSERQSYRRLGVLLDQYEAMVREVDAARAQGGDWTVTAERVHAERDAIENLAAEIRADLKTE